MKRSFGGICVFVGALMWTSAASGFTYNPPGKLVGNSGQGNTTTKDYTPGMRFPIEKAPAYPNSQVYGAGGLYGPPGGQCAKSNYSYPWWDNYCEKRSWSMPLCPSGKGHQGQDIRPGTCEFNKHWAVAAEDGTITSIGTYSVYLKGKSGTTHRYLHLKMTALAVKKGHLVKKGQKLGLVDNDFGGTPTSLHLHYDRKQYVTGVGSVYVPTYMYLVNSYKVLIGAGGPTCDAQACSAKSSCSKWGACGGFSSVCDKTGKQTRTCSVYACTSGVCKVNKKTETKSCTVNTDGKQVKSWSGWGTCKPGAGACNEEGKKSRTRVVCKGGKSITVSESAKCTVATEGKVVTPWSAWSACGNFQWPCDESGTRKRKRTVCKSGKPTQAEETKTCKVDKSGQQVQAWSDWSTCVGVAGSCDNKGTQSRTRLVCQDEASVPEKESRACSRNTDGVVAKPWTAWTKCSATPLVCGGEGVSSKTRFICEGGVAVAQTEKKACVVNCSDGGRQADRDVDTGHDGALTGVTDDISSQQQVTNGIERGAGSSACSAVHPVTPDLHWPEYFLILAACVCLWMRRRTSTAPPPAA